MKRLTIFYCLLSIVLLGSIAHGAAISSNGTGGGNWSAGATWVGASVPVNLDTVTIVLGDEVTFDVDQSGFANGISLTVTGTFTCSTAAGAYYLMCNADIEGAGLFQAGTSGTALPSTVTFKVDFNAGSFHFNGSGGLTVNIYCTQPTNTFVKLNGVEAAGQVTLSIDTDLTSDWSVGDWVIIADMNGGKDVEKATIDAIRTGPNELDIDVGDSGVPTGLVSQKESGAYIVVIERNIVVTNGEDVLYRDVDDSYIRCLNDCKTDDSVSNSCVNTEFAGIDWESTNNSTIYHLAAEKCTFSGIFAGSTSGTASDGLFACYGCTFSGLAVGMDDTCDECYNCILSGEIRGCDYGLDGGREWSMTSAAVIDNCFRAIYSNSGGFYYGTLTNNSRNVELQTGGIFNCTMSGASVGDFVYVAAAQCYNTTFGSATEFYGYNTKQRGKISYVESSDHDGTVNAFKAWCRGGIVTSQTATPPSGYDVWYEHACEDDGQDYPVFRQFETTVNAGNSIEVGGQIRIADGEDLTGYEPALQIIDKFADPLVDSTQSPLDEDKIPEPDGGVEAGWQDVDVIWANTGDAPRTVIIRMIAWHDGGGNDVDIDEVWNIADYKDQINTLYNIVAPLKTDVATADTATSFTLTAGEPTNDAYNNMTVMVQDADDDHWELRSISDWTSGLVITVSTAFSFTPAQDDLVYIMGTAYGAPVDTAAIADAVWDETSAGHTDAGEAGEQLWTDIDSILSGVTNLANVGAAVNTPPKADPNGFDITTGTNEGNNEDSTHALDGTNHTIDSTGNELDVYYEFTVGGDGVPVSTVVTGYLNGNNDDLEVHAYNWGTPGWDQVGVLEGKALTTNEVHAYNLFTTHVGTGTDLGTVRIRFTDGAYNLTAATLTVDQIYVSYSVVHRSVGYADGAIWVDDTAGNTNTESYIDGTADNPVSTWAAALTISNNLGLNRFHIASGTTITLSANSDNYELLGWEWTLALGGQSLAGAYINGAAVTGTMTGTAARFFFCKMGQDGTATLSACGMKDCAIAGSLVLTSAGTYLMDGCFSGIAGTSTPDIDFGSGVGDTALNIRHYSGGIEIKNMNTTGTDTMSLEGFGQLVLNSSCAGGTIAMRGHFTVTDNASGAVTLSDLAAFDHNTIIDDILVDSNELQTDWTDGGRLDVIIDAIKYKTDLISLIDTVVKDSNDANNFTIEDGTDVNDAYWFMAIQVEDADGNLSKEIRWINYYDENSGDPNIWVDEPFSFTPAVGDVAHIMGTTYGGFLYRILNDLQQTKGVLNVIDQTAGGTGGLDRAGAIRIDALGDDP